MLFLILFFAAVLLVDVVLFSYDKYWVSLAVFAGSIAALTQVPAFAGFFSFDYHDYIKIALEYIAAGIVTAGLKWVLFTFDISNKVKIAVEEFDNKYVAPEGKIVPIPVAVPVDGTIDLNKLDTPASPVQTQRVVLTDAELKAHRRAAFTDFIADERSFRNTVWSSIMKLTAREMPTIDAKLLAAEDGVTNLFTPKARKYIDRITSWVFQWPVVILATIFDNFLVKLGKHVATFLDAAFGKLSKVIVGRATKGL